jgi:putative hemolysin
MGKQALAWSAAALVLAACGNPGPPPPSVLEETPTVTYRYDGDPHGDGLAEVTNQAAAYCQQKYGRQPRLQQVRQDQGANYALFACR